MAYLLTPCQKVCQNSLAAEIINFTSAGLIDNYRLFWYNISMAERRIFGSKKLPESHITLKDRLGPVPTQHTFLHNELNRDRVALGGDPNPDEIEGNGMPPETAIDGEGPLMRFDKMQLGRPLATGAGLLMLNILPNLATYSSSLQTSEIQLYASMAAVVLANMHLMRSRFGEVKIPSWIPFVNEKGKVGIPKGSVGILVFEAARQAGAVLVGAYGVPFVFDQLPQIMHYLSQTVSSNEETVAFIARTIGTMAVGYMWSTTLIEKPLRRLMKILTQYKLEREPDLRKGEPKIMKAFWKLERAGTAVMIGGGLKSRGSNQHLSMDMPKTMAQWKEEEVEYDKQLEKERDQYHKNWMEGFLRDVVVGDVNRHGQLTQYEFDKLCEAFEHRVTHERDRGESAKALYYVASHRLAGGKKTFKGTNLEACLSRIVDAYNHPDHKNYRNIEDI